MTQVIYLLILMSVIFKRRLFNFPLNTCVYFKKAISWSVLCNSFITNFSLRVSGAGSQGTEILVDTNTAATNSIGSFVLWASKHWSRYHKPLSTCMQHFHTRSKTAIATLRITRVDNAAKTTDIWRKTRLQKTVITMKTQLFEKVVIKWKTDYL